jgi:hypothetical protein
LKSKPFYVVYDMEATKNSHSWEGKPPKWVQEEGNLKRGGKIMEGGKGGSGNNSREVFLELHIDCGACCLEYCNKCACKFKKLWTILICQNCCIMVGIYLMF